MTQRIMNFSSSLAQIKLGDITRWLGILAIAFTLAACSGGGGEEPLNNVAGDPPGSPPAPPGSPPAPPPPPPPPPPPSMTDETIFAATLYPQLAAQTNFCVGCHGASQDPTFAVGDVTTAYNAIVSQQKVNLANPELSRIYLRPFSDRHNCGGVMICDRIAADFLTAIQDWATQSAALGPPPTTVTPVLSMATTFADALDGGAARIDDNAIALFTFSEGTGDVTMDTSGVGTPIALQITGMEWVNGGGLRNLTGKAQANQAESQKLFDMISVSTEYTVEAWIIPENNAQDGPARIVSYSLDTAERNFTMGQNAIYYQLRNRSAGTGINGSPALEALVPEVQLNLTHVAMTFDAATGRKVYINGQLSIEENVPDTLDWQATNLLVLGNETTDNRLWMGEFRLVAIHDKALTGAEIQQNFDAGSGSLVTLRFDVSGPVGEAAFIDMQATQVDPFGYMLARPIFVSDAPSTAIKNIRIAVNGGVPVAAQPFRRVDMVVTQTGTELSPLGALIPVALGMADDVFHLEFEAIGGQFGTTEPAVPSAPPLPVPDIMEPELGLRTFSQVNDTMSSLTGINANQNTVLARYNELRGSLPATSELLAFAPAQQIAIQRLATTYCGEIVTNAGNCNAFFGACAIDVNGKDQVATTLYDRFIGDNIANQPARAGVTTEVVRMIDDLGCMGGCTGATAETALQATCAAVLSSGAITVN